MRLLLGLALVVEVRVFNGFFLFISTFKWEAEKLLRIVFFNWCPRCLSSYIRAKRSPSNIRKNCSKEPNNLCNSFSISHRSWLPWTNSDIWKGDSGTKIHSGFQKSESDAFAPVRHAIGMTIGDTLFVKRDNIVV